MNEELASEKQLNYMKGLGLEVPQGCTKAMARQLIEGKVGKGDSMFKPPQSQPKETTVIPAETANRDRLIVRQCCLKAAVEVANASLQHDKTPWPSPEILELAEELEEWVFR